MDWFEEWFDSPYYHVLYKNRDFNEAELFIRNLLRHLSLPYGAKIIDMPCGKGRHSIFLNKQGYTVIGLDLSPASIQHAKQYESTTLQFHTHDMREVWEDSDADAVFNIFTSFGYFDSDSEDQRCVKAFTSALRPKGKLVVDFMNIHKVLAGIQVQEKKVVDTIEFAITKRIEAGFLIKNIRFHDKGKDFSFQEKVRILYKEDFIKYFNFAGLELVDIFGDYQLNAYNAAISDRLILIAQKQ
jgi:cyclopropane fatty-acyl-phospholipid synthase-like methyltransferase